MSTDKELEIKRPIDPEFGGGLHLYWKDGEEKEVIITGWYQKDKKVVEKDGTEVIKPAFVADVLHVSGIKYEVGEKIIDVTSKPFQRAIRDKILEADSAGINSLHLRIKRQGSDTQTVYFIDKIDPKTQAQKNMKILG